MAKPTHARHVPRTSWDPIAYWYDGWMGRHGSSFHRTVAIPLLLDQLAVKPGQRILDIGCGQGVLAPHAAAARCRYTGVDASRILIDRARRRFPQHRFVLADAANLERSGIRAGSYDAVTFLLSIQDMQPLTSVLEAAARALVASGRLALVMSHPCFRIPRQSGWGYDEGRRLVYRRVDSYLTARRIPLRLHGRKRARTASFHRPLHDYVNTLTAVGFRIDAIRERGAEARRGRGNPDIPVLLGIAARKG